MNGVPLLQAAARAHAENVVQRAEVASSHQEVRTQAVAPPPAAPCLRSSDLIVVRHSRSTEAEDYIRYGTINHNSPVPSTLPRFPEFPKEIRIQIIGLAVSEPRILKQVLVGFGGTSPPRHEAKWICPKVDRVPALLHVNRECRKELLYDRRFKKPHPTYELFGFPVEDDNLPFYFSAELDTLFDPAIPDFDGGRPSRRNPHLSGQANQTTLIPILQVCKPVLMFTLQHFAFSLRSPDSYTTRVPTTPSKLRAADTKTLYSILISIPYLRTVTILNSSTRQFALTIDTSNPFSGLSSWTINDEGKPIDSTGLESFFEYTNTRRGSSTLVLANLNTNTAQTANPPAALPQLNPIPLHRPTFHSHSPNPALNPLHNPPSTSNTSQNAVFNFTQAFATFSLASANPDITDPPLRSAPQMDWTLDSRTKALCARYRDFYRGPDGDWRQLQNRGGVAAVAVWKNI